MNKSELCEKHLVLLQVIYFLGGGIMFVTQLQEFMKKHKTQLWRDISELYEAGLIDKVFIDKHCVLKIKAYVIRYFEEKENVGSIEVTAYKIQKSAMISAILLRNYGALCQKPEKILSYAATFTNFVKNDNADLYMLERLKTSMEKHELSTERLTKTMHDLKECDFYKYRMHLNFYFENFKQIDDEFVISIAILDLSSAAPTVIADRIYSMFDKCDSMFQNNLRIKDKLCIHYSFNFYVRDSYREKYTIKQIVKITQCLQRINLDLSRISLAAVNLELTSSVFSNHILFL